MTTRIWTKPQTQQTLKALRQAGYAVMKKDSSYEVLNDGVVVLKAMIGTNGYLVRYVSNLFDDGKRYQVIDTSGSALTASMPIEEAERALVKLQEETGEKFTLRNTAN